MIELVYESTDGRFWPHLTYCISHLYSEEEFDEDMEDALIPLRMRDLKSIKAYHKDVPDTPLVAEYKRLVMAYLGKYLNDDFSVSFTPNTPKQYVLALLNFIRPIEEEGDWFMAAMVEPFSGSLFTRLRMVLQDIDTYYFRNGLHQSFAHTITERSDLELAVLEDHFTDYLDWLKIHGAPIVGSFICPDYPASMDGHFQTFLEVKKEWLKRSY